MLPSGPPLDWSSYNPESAGTGYNPNHMTGDDAKFYADYYGYDSDIKTGIDIGQAILGGGYYGATTWTFSKNGEVVEKDMSSADLA
jgi:hypothetical protein